DLIYYLAVYDREGRERQDDPDGLMSEKLAQLVGGEPMTDVFIMSHGWKGDIPAAVEQYDRWTKAMADRAADRAAIRQRRPTFKPLIVGFHWPSQPWGDEEFGVGGARASFAIPGVPAGAGAVATSVGPAIDAFVDLYADRIADTPRARSAIRTIVTHAMAAGPAGDALSQEVADAYVALNDEAGLGSGGPD